MSAPLKPPGEGEPTYRLVAKNLAEMVLAYDMGRRLLFANPAAESMTGYSLAELESAGGPCWVHGDDRERMMAHWEKLFAGASFYEKEYRLLTKDGRMKWAVASWAPILDDDGRQVGVQGRERDITERKLEEETVRHAEQKHRVDEERYRALFEESPFAMWEEDFSAVKRYLDSLKAGGVQDLRAYLTARREALEECLRRVRVLDVNRAAREFYSASSKEDLLDDLSKIFDERAWENFREEMVALAENGSSFRAEFPTQTLSGEERLVNMIVSIVDTPRRDWSRVIVSFFDVTDRKRLEEQMAQSQKMESLGRLAGGIAHDFNNLLTVINGYSDMVLQEPALTDRVRAAVTEIRTAGSRCAEMTRQLLAFSRKQAIKPGPVDLNRIIRESQTVMRSVLGDDVRLSLTLDANLGNIDADLGQMHQVLMNLVVNAREAMPGGGTLRIETRVAGEYALLEVEDTGSGMDERTRQHLFEPFFTTKRNRKSTGLGLATVFGIVKFAGGRIEVDSAPNEGAAFRVYLPRSPLPVAAAQEDIPARVDFRGSGTILLVDDREDVRSLTGRILEEMGFRVLAASSGADAMVVAGGEQGPIHVLLTDVIMPGMNGRELAERLKPLRGEMQVIFMSGYTDQILRDSAVPYLQKPFTRAGLVEALRRVIQP